MGWSKTQFATSVELCFEPDVDNLIVPTISFYPWFWILQGGHLQLLTANLIELVTNNVLNFI